MDEEFDPESRQPDIRETIDHKVTNDNIQLLLEGINLEQRACWILRVQQGATYEEIAEILKININTVRSRLKRAREAVVKRAQERKVLI